jgi:sulfatase maturation enzyme AslB (radical SAM superfamily)
MARWLRYDLRAGSVEAAVRDFLPAVRRMTVTHDDTCRRCELLILCSNCAAWAHREVGDPEAQEPFRCRLAHLRQQSLGLNVQFVTIAENTKREE